MKLNAARLELTAQFDVIVDFAIEGDEEAVVERRLRLTAVLRVDDAQAARAHGGVLADGDQRIGDVAPMQQPRDQTLDRRFSAIPIDGYRNAAHIAPHSPKPLKTNVDRYG